MMISTREEDLHVSILFATSSIYSAVGCLILPVLSRAHSLCTNKLIPIQWSTSMGTRQDSKASQQNPLPSSWTEHANKNGLASATLAQEHGANRTDTRHPANGGDYYFRCFFFCSTKIVGTNLNAYLTLKMLYSVFTKSDADKKLCQQKTTTTKWRTDTIGTERTNPMDGKKKLEKRKHDVRSCVARTKQQGK